MPRNKTRRTDNTRARALTEALRDYLNNLREEDMVIVYGTGQELEVTEVVDAIQRTWDARSFSFHVRGNDHNGRRDYRISVAESKDGFGANTRSFDLWDHTTDD
jgi:hypothetical protein